jgi:hypothetical protein
MPPRAPAFRTATCRRYLRYPLQRVPVRLYPTALHTRQLRPQPYGLSYAERVLIAHYSTPTMALNASSHNVAGEKTGPTTAPPPALSDDVKKDLLDAANTDGVGQSAPGRENEKGVEKKEKSAKELEKERKKAEKDAKFKAKKAAAAGAPKEGGAPKENKKKKGKEEEQLPEYVEETPKGEKKRLQSLDGPFTKAYIPKVVESAWCEYPADKTASAYTDQKQTTGGTRRASSSLTCPTATSNRPDTSSFPSLPPTLLASFTADTPLLPHYKTS